MGQSCALESSVPMHSSLAAAGLERSTSGTARPTCGDAASHGFSRNEGMPLCPLESLEPVIQPTGLSSCSMHWSASATDFVVASLGQVAAECGFELDPSFWDALPLIRQGQHEGCDGPRSAAPQHGIKPQRPRASLRSLTGRAGPLNQRAENAADLPAAGPSPVDPLHWPETEARLLELEQKHPPGVLSRSPAQRHAQPRTI